MPTTHSPRLARKSDGLSSFGERLRLRREKLHLRKQELAAAIGVSLTTIQQYENGQLPKGEYAVRLACELHCSLDWLLAGHGDDEHNAHRRAPSDANRLLGDAPHGLNDFDSFGSSDSDCADGYHGGYHDDTLDYNKAPLVMVPMVEARLSAGGGSFESGGSTLRHYAFRQDFLQRKGKPSSMVLLRVTGDSMQPRILNNDVVLIDQSQVTPLPGRIYAVGVEDMVYLKIVDALPGKLILSSVNPDYAPIEACTTEQMADLVRIIGRAVWVGRELD